MGAKISTEQALKISDWFLPENFTGFYGDDDIQISYPFLEEIFGRGYNVYSSAH